MREVGLSKQKSVVLESDLAGRHEGIRALDFARLPNLPDEEVIESTSRR